MASTGDSQDSVEMRYEDENIWLTQKMMATLYDVDVRTINHHIKKIFEDSELTEESVIRKFRITAADGKQYNMQDYANGMIAKFIMGKEELTPETFQAYLDQLEALGLSDYLAIRQAAYDRFTARAE